MGRSTCTLHPICTRECKTGWKVGLNHLCSENCLFPDWRDGAVSKEQILLTAEENRVVIGVTDTSKEPIALLVGPLRAGCWQRDAPTGRLFMHDNETVTSPRVARSSHLNALQLNLRPLP